MTFSPKVPMDGDEDIFDSDDVSPLVLFLVGCDVLNNFNVEIQGRDRKESSFLLFIFFYSRK